MAADAVDREAAALWLWRFDLYVRAGVAAPVAETLANLELDSRDVLALLDGGCPEELLVAILA